ncbi:MAG TPA: SUMF1/EgtB/PvdO family nonheme iron enzyme [Planctomycetota bacterium]|nr:SUMF1/EgtB/PvdO family nonheme iron enzyme [Planctomycetota bacterium]
MPALLPFVLAGLLAAQQKTPVPETVAIPAGKIKSSEREVELPAFRMGVKELTWTEFNAYFESKDLADGVDAVTRPTRAIAYFGQVGVPSHFLDPTRPVTNLRWHSIIGYCDWLSKKTGAYYRPPTEAEWEYAARAGETGVAPAKPEEAGWVKSNSEARTHEGGEKKANAFGLYDTVGNVWEYCLEFQKGSEFSPVLKGGCWSTPGAEIPYGVRQGVPQAWFDEDPNRPRSVWWLTNKDWSQGLRVAQVADAADQKDRAAAAAKIEVKISSGKEKTLKVDKSSSEWAEVAGEIKNAGDKELVEVEILLYYLNPKGKPHLIDVAGTNKPGQATFTKCWPVLATGNGAEAAKPLKPGETRKFTADIPSSFDTDDDVEREKFAGRATNVRLAK